MTRPPNKITGPNAGGPRQFFNSDATGRPRRSVRSLACFTRMPVSIYRVTPEGQKNESIAWLCDGNWRLPDQAERPSKRGSRKTVRLSSPGSTLRISASRCERTPVEAERLSRRR